MINDSKILRIMYWSLTS